MSETSTGPTAASPAPAAVPGHTPPAYVPREAPEHDGGARAFDDGAHVVGGLQVTGYEVHRPSHRLCRGTCRRALLRPSRVLRRVGGETSRSVR